MADWSKPCALVLQSKPGNETYFDNLFGSSYSSGVAALTAASVTPVKKVSVFDTGKIDKTSSENVENWSGTEKQEGIMMLNDCTLAIGDDRGWNTRGCWIDQGARSGGGCASQARGCRGCCVAPLTETSWLRALL